MSYILAVFNSRTQTMLFYNKLKAKRIPCSIINNPEKTNVTCGICIKFYYSHLNVARQILNNNLNGFVGFYKLQNNLGRNIVTPL